MTNSNSGDRLNQIEAILMRVAQQQEANTTAIANLQSSTSDLQSSMSDLQSSVESNTRNIDILTGIVTGHQERLATIFEEIRDIKVEIRGLQTENRRLLDHLFGQQDNDER